jgi:hypothetical protein
MLVNVMASAAAFQKPTILLNPLDDLAIFQILTATSLTRIGGEHVPGAEARICGEIGCPG